MTSTDSNTTYFSIVDDTDHATVGNVKPVYDLLSSLGIRTTKTVWSLPCLNQDYLYSDGQTLQDRDYADWIRSLSKDGFEIALHGVAGDSSLRARTVQGLEEFVKVLGQSPKMHINHAANRDSLYFRSHRFNSSLVRLFVRLGASRSNLVFDGHVPQSPYFWGDIASKTVRYCRNMTFPNRINLRKINPTMPYRDPLRDFIPRWFSSCDGGDPKRFVHLLSKKNLETLERERGVCIVYTHFGSGFVQDGKVLPAVERAIRMVADMQSRFLPASDLLDTLCATGEDAPVLRFKERQFMEYRWLLSKILTGGTS